MAGAEKPSSSSDRPRLAARLGAQLLDRRPGRTPEDVVARLLAVQAQDPRGARLSIRSRAAGLTAVDVDRALTEHRSLVVTWLQRGTLHLVGADDYWWLHPLTTPQLATGNDRRLAQEGVTPAQAERGVAVVADAVQDGPRTRSQLQAALDAAGVPTAGQALVHLLAATSRRADLVRGPMVDGQHAFVSAAAWLGPGPDPIERDQALARLARRYLAGHGPADDRDLAKWAGITLGAARSGLKGIADEVRTVGNGLVDLIERDTARALPAPGLLGPFDPALLGWVSRAQLVGPHEVVTSNGIIRPVALVDGRVVAIWGLAAGTVSFDFLTPPSATAAAALRGEVADVLAFLGLPDREPIGLRTGPA